MSGDWMRKDKQSRTVLLYSPLLAKNQESTCPTLQASTDIPATVPHPTQSQIVPVELLIH